MSEEELKRLQEYNLEYLEAQASEEMFGGDYTSAVELKQAKQEIERLKEDNEYLNKVNVELSTEKNRLNNIIKNTAVELEILLQSEDLELIIMQLRNIVFRLKGSDKD